MSIPIQISATETYLGKMSFKLLVLLMSQGSENSSPPSLFPKLLQNQIIGVDDRTPAASHRPSPARKSVETRARDQHNDRSKTTQT